MAGIKNILMIMALLLPFQALYAGDTVLPVSADMPVADEALAEAEPWAESEAESAQDKAQAEAETTEPNWIDRSHGFVEDAVLWVGEGTDRLLSGNARDVENESYIRLRLAQVFEEGGKSFSKHDIKFKIDLPKTEDRLQLVFDNDPDDFESLTEQNRDVSSDRQNLRNADSDVSAALRWLLPVLDNWKTSVDVGVRAKLPLDPFIKLKARRVFPLPDLWHLRMRHELYYYHRRGLGEKSAFVFDRPLGEDWLFSTIFELQWRDKDSSLEYAGFIVFNHQLSEADTFTWRTGAFYEENPKSHLESYFADVTYRRLLYRDWLYAELIPAVQWLRETDFDDDYSLTARLEILFKN